MNNINIITKKLAAKEFMNKNSKKDMRIYKAEMRKAKSLLYDIIDNDII